MSDATHHPAAKRTPLYDLHVKLGAKMVPFAGYDMPVQYEGILAEHQHARRAAVLFDVSHMGQAVFDDAGAAAFEQLVVADVRSMSSGRMRYTVMTNDRGGIIDDLIMLHSGAFLHVIANASRKDIVFPRLAEHLDDGVNFTVREDRGLLALQGPQAATVLARFAPPARLMLFMTCETLTIGDVKCMVSRSGYTGEDGFEISMPADRAKEVAKLLLQEPEVHPAGLGARDTLRLEAGLCLYGNDIDETTTPIEAGLAWTIHKRRRQEGGFPGDTLILRQLREGPPRTRVGIRLDGRQPARTGSAITDTAGRAIGHVTSGSFGPTVGAPIAMGYVEPAMSEPGTAVHLIVRDKPLAGRIAPLPFVEHRYAK